MTLTKSENKAISLTVTEGITVTIIPNQEHEFLMSTKEVASGYGVTTYNIRQHKLSQSSELIEGKHYLGNVSITHGASCGASRSTMWTKRGIVRLGFFIKSEQAKLFRDWAEDLIIKFEEQRDLFGTKEVVVQKQLKAKRDHNRITKDRLVDLLAEVCKISDSELRMSITNKLMGR